MSNSITSVWSGSEEILSVLLMSDLMFVVSRLRIPFVHYSEAVSGVLVVLMSLGNRGS